MLTIRREQLEVFSRGVRDQFVKKLVGVLRDALPEYLYHMSDAEAFAMASRLTDEALRFGIDRQNQTATYVQRRVEAGHAFDHALELNASFRNTLEDPDVPARRKLEMIFERFFALK